MNNESTLGSSRAILYNCKNQSDRKVWYSRGLVGDDFRSRHTILMLHIWMIHRRLLMENDKGRSIQECLFDELWEDSSHRIRALGVNELSVNKRLSEVQGYSLKCCIELDHAILGKSEDQIIDDIGGTIWRFLYMKRNEIHVDHVLELARYIRREELSLIDLNKDVIFDGRIKWGELPAWIATKKESNKIEEKNKEKESGPWKTAVSPSGKTYYWNSKTRQTQWDMPSDYIP